MTTQLKDVSTINAFAFAGNATISLRSSKTGARYTYKIQRAKPSNEGQDERELPLFVKLLTGTDNENDFSFIGTIFPRNPSRLTTSRKAFVPATSQCFKAFAWWLTHIGDERVEVWHEDRCGRCGRKLTVPESIATGLGPHCAKRMGVNIVQLTMFEAKNDSQEHCFSPHLGDVK